MPPLFFLDYIAVGKLNFKKTKNLLKGIFKGCALSDCNLIGGETAEMPGIYSKDKFDLAGFSVGIVSKKKILSKYKVKEKNIILAIPSNGIHSNGFSLVRSVFEKKIKFQETWKELLKPTKIYTNEILKSVEKNYINALAHITGGGLVENLLRSIPENLCLNLDLSLIKIQKKFLNGLKQNLSDSEMMKRLIVVCVGFCIILPEKNISKINDFFSKKFKPYRIGHVSSKRKGKVNLIKTLKW